MSARTLKLRQLLFSRRPRDRDVYHTAITERLRPGMAVLDVGCGKGQLNPFPWHDHPAIELTGIDTDPEAATNPSIAEFHLIGTADGWGVPAEKFDVVVCRYVLEHVEDPNMFLREIRRALKPGGKFVFLTPSRFYPVMLVSNLLPHRAHRWILARTKKSAANDVFSTHYRMNSKRDLRRLAAEHEFEIEILVQRDFQPADYFDFNVVLFLLNLAVFEIFKLTRLDRQFGASILGVFIKATQTGATGRFGPEVEKVHEVHAR